MLPPLEIIVRSVRFRKELSQILGRPEENVAITCAECGINDNCEFAWDHYNTDGDCLAEK